MSKSKPASTEHGVAFDLASLAASLRQESAYERLGHAARTLVRVPDQRVVLIALRAGAQIAEHKADETVSIHVTSGKVRVRLPDRVSELSAGQLLVLEHGLRHDVEGVTDSALVLTLGWRGED